VPDRDAATQGVQDKIGRVGTFQIRPDQTAAVRRQRLSRAFAGTFSGSEFTATADPVTIPGKLLRDGFAAETAAKPRMACSLKKVVEYAVNVRVEMRNLRRP
jgi:hypothetical protein